MIIGLSGYAQSGKDTVANYLVEYYGYSRIAFADPLRQAVYKLNPRIDVGDMRGVYLANAVDNLGWDRVKVESEQARELLQRMGTEVGREMFGQNFWVDYAMREVSKSDKVVFTDVRFPNEYESIKERGGLVWRIERPGIVAVNNHISETAMDSVEVDKIILNNSTPGSLHETLDYLMQHL